jgi:hypothetical protein
LEKYVSWKKYIFPCIYTYKTKSLEDYDYLWGVKMVLDILVGKDQRYFLHCGLQ